MYVLAITVVPPIAVPGQVAATLCIKRIARYSYPGRRLDQIAAACGVLSRVVGVAYSLTTAQVNASNSP